MSDGGATSGGKLPVWRAVRAAYAAPFQEPSTLARAASTWLATTTPLMFVLNWLLWPYQPSVRTEAASSLGSILFDTSSVWIVLLELLPMSSIAVAWHRRLLLEEPVKSWSYFRLDRLVGIFALTNLLIALPELIPTLGLGLTASHLSTDSNPIGAMTHEQLMAFLVNLGMLWIGIIAMIFLAPRLSIILPAKAVGSTDITIRKIWHASRGQTWRLALGSLLTYLPFLPLVAVYYAVSSAGPTQFDFAFFNALYYFVSMILNIIFVGFISFAYRHLVEQDSRRLASVFLPT